MNAKALTTVNYHINGVPRQLTLSPAMSLAEVLRAEGLLSVKLGCHVGKYGACTVLVDDVAIDSFLYLAIWAQGKTIRTVEGELTNGIASKIQQTYVNNDAVQCGFYIPGLIMATTAFLAKPRTEPLSIKQIRHRLAGNLCRCTGYQMIIDAIQHCE
ncbi:Nicotinate dehydrogenase small FeS subunit [Arsenophonus endosymbiont of Aleurodicus floccissimus]|uniref:xanthine dehydrogenase iron sulfur-binding subunit XdhC n=1 Tax=Arsenophonus endosymbiont of Aleurodicus floccissimus TaxID=2152761 RepID=UPI000E6B0ABC|nr:xanthine dehydrogenase iron sulfur-binding subunit XdhC [Arsenophonus endosymbiont of Aleurodicus floccissimus]SPP32123.1 Nicotinate dehydrogenase small FeS subunit [Arsenophonus endosymbiont of Aleurodicus floccissimus]